MPETTLTTQKYCIKDAAGDPIAVLYTKSSPGVSAVGKAARQMFGVWADVADAEIASGELDEDKVFGRRKIGDKLKPGEQLGEAVARYTVHDDRGWLREYVVASGIDSAKTHARAKFGASATVALDPLAEAQRLTYESALREGKSERDAATETLRRLPLQAGVPLTRLDALPKSGAITALERQAFEMSKALGSTDREAAIAALGRDARTSPERFLREMSNEPSDIDDLAEGFRALGMSESQAGMAARGR
ncbi:MAG: hypothetical protein WD557_05775 [Dehalococcoidia bacterium]